MKKAFLNFNPSDLPEKFSLAEDLCDQGYELYADGKTALFFNKNMIPTNTLCDKTMKFDFVAC